VTVGDVLSVGVHVRSSRAQPITLVVSFLDAAGAVLSASYADTALVPAGVITRLAMDGSDLGAVPSGAASISIAAAVSLTDGVDWANGDTFQASKVSATKTPAVIDWFDGDTVSSYWLGTPDASESERVFTYPALTPYTDDSPSPRVDVLFDDMLPDTVTATVYQISSDGQVPVRHAGSAFASGGLFITDYEVPFGVPVTYRAQQFDADGNDLGFTDSASTQVDIPVGKVIISDPLDPSAAVRLDAELRFAEALTRKRDVAVYKIGLETVALMGAQGLLEGLNLRVIAFTDADQVAFDDVLSRTQVLVRTMPPMPVPRALHVVIPEASRVPFDARTGGTASVWDIAGQEVSRSTLSIIVPVVTWQAYIDAFPTWADFNAAYSTWLDAEQNPPAVA